ncbi:MAG TPA: gliding motility-associated C-terminal domain-containing protein [Bacteroidales bacterium]|jgi:gliding motility-associated-like protein|nr:gliding motility-associated C-terminal domain-containing protein [Bacteroidales bacterium]HPE41108.1 gliding motility-associated C-terminal domain-containing protein [Bacteroidales bacterium]
MKEVGQYFKEKLDQYKPDVTEQFWTKIQNDKGLKKFNRTALIKRALLYYITPVSIVLITGAVLWSISNNQNPDLKTVEVLTIQNNTISEPTEPQQEPYTTPVASMESEPTVSKREQSSVSISKPDPTNKNNNPVISKNEPVSKNKPVQNTTTEPNLNPTTIKTTPANNSKQPDLVKNNTPKPSQTEPKTSIPDTTEAIEEERAHLSTDPDEDKKLFIPKGFTPNNDGKNDLFFVYADWEVDSFEITIYQRGGIIVYKSNDIQQGWDGLFQNMDAPQGAYVYIITYKNQKGDDKMLKGTLNLIR